MEPQYLPYLKLYTSHLFAEWQPPNFAFAPWEDILKGGNFRVLTQPGD